MEAICSQNLKELSAKVAHVFFVFHFLPHAILFFVLFCFVLVFLKIAYEISRCFYFSNTSNLRC